MSRQVSFSEIVGQVIYLDALVVIILTTMSSFILIFIILQDEKNQVLTSNVWIRQASQALQALHQLGFCTLRKG